jgi:hypothetical protein
MLHMPVTKSSRALGLSVEELGLVLLALLFPCVQLHISPGCFGQLGFQGPNHIPALLGLRPGASVGLVRDTPVAAVSGFENPADSKINSMHAAVVSVETWANSASLKNTVPTC